MKKKIINGLLFAVAMIAATSSFVSCKDYDGDNYNELQEKYLTLQGQFVSLEAVVKQQAGVMANYVLLTESGWTRSELANKTIKDRLAELGIDVKNYTDTQFAGAKDYTDGKVSDVKTELQTWTNQQLTNLQTNMQTWTTQQLANYVTLNQLTIQLADYLNQANGYTDNKIADAVAEAKLYTDQKITALENLWGPKLEKAVNAANEVEAHSADWNNTTQEWNNVKDLIAKMLEDYDKTQGGWKPSAGSGSDTPTFATIQDVIDYFYEADNKFSDEIAALQKDLDKLLRVLEAQVTGIEIQGTVNPIYGTFAYPIGVQSNILATYFGKTDVPVYFPAGDGEDADYWVGSQPVILTSELNAIGAPVQEFGADGYLINNTEGNAGKLYVTVNPSDVDMTGKEFTLRTSDNKVSKVVLSTLEPSIDQLKWGYKRAAVEENSPNGFYVANATINQADVEDVALSFDMGGVKSQLKSIMNDWRATTAADIAKLGLTVLNSMQTNVPRLGVQAQWKDSVTLGWKNWVSKYELAAFSAKPLGYDFLYGKDFSPKVIKLKNKIFAKEQAIAQEFYDEIINMIKIDFGLPTTGGNIYVDEATGKIYLRIPANSIKISGEGVVKVTKGQFGSVDIPNTPPATGSTTYYFPDEDKELKATVNASNPEAIDMEITPLFDTIAGTIEKALANVADKAGNTIYKYLEKIINAENKIFAKIESVAKNPNRLIQPALVAAANKTDLFYPSRNYLVPTKVKKGTTISFYPTTLTAEVVAPAFKKYIAISNVKEGGIWQPGAQYNTGGILNTVINGETYNIMTPFEYTVNAPAGTVLEFIYECLGYNGKVAGKKYYIEVY